MHRAAACFCRPGHQTQALPSLLPSSLTITVAPFFKCGMRPSCTFFSNVECPALDHGWKLCTDVPLASTRAVCFPHTAYMQGGPPQLPMCALLLKHQGRVAAATSVGVSTQRALGRPRMYVMTRRPAHRTRCVMTHRPPLSWGGVGRLAFGCKHTTRVATTTGSSHGLRPPNQSSIRCAACQRSRTALHLVPRLAHSLAHRPPPTRTSCSVSSVQENEWNIYINKEATHTACIAQH